MGVIIAGFATGIFFIYKSKKTDARLLFYMALCGILVSLTWLGGFTDFLTILLTGKNYIFDVGLGMMWAPMLSIIAIYIGNELLIPEKKELKWFILFTFIILGITFEIIIFLKPETSFEFQYPSIDGEDLVDSYLVFNSTAGFIYLINYLFVLIQWGIGFLIKSIQSEGIIRKKFLILSIGIFILLSFAFLDGLFNFIIIFARIGVISSFIVFYFGLREEPEKKVKMRQKREIKVEESLFRLTKRPDTLTEEEITYHKEKRICLICKGKLSKFNIFICDCDTLYCENCARALSNLENMCWVCFAPIDDLKPTKPFSQEKKDLPFPETTDRKIKVERSK